MPKILYIARNCWLTKAVIVELQRFVKAFIWGKAGDRPRRAWVGEEQSELQPHWGGFAMPHIETELLTMAAATVA